MKKRSTRPITAVLVIAGFVATAAIVTAGAPAKLNRLKDAGARERKNADEAPLLSAAERKPLSYYTGGNIENLFGSVATAAPAPQPVVGKAVEKHAPPTPAPTPQPAPDPYEDYVYSGWVKQDGTMLALIENRKTRVGKYVAVGDKFEDQASVSAMSDDSVTLSANGKQYAILRPTTYDLVPLNASASFLREAAEKEKAATAGAGGNPGGPNPQDGPGGETSSPGVPDFRNGQGFPGFQGFPGGFGQGGFGRGGFGRGGFGPGGNGRGGPGGFGRGDFGGQQPAPAPAPDRQPEPPDD